jgi:hypothetical protein
MPELKMDIKEIIPQCGMSRSPIREFGSRKDGA